VTAPHITDKIRWLIKSAKPTPTLIVLSEQDIKEIEDYWNTSVDRTGNCLFEGVQLMSDYYYRIESEVEKRMANNSTPKVSNIQHHTILTPGQVLDWKKGLSHQHLDASYLITDRGERIHVEELTPDIIYGCKYFVVGEQELSVCASEIAALMNLAYNCGEDGVERNKMKNIIENSLVSLGFEDFIITGGEHE
jgi:hypothetical protein